MSSPFGYHGGVLPGPGSVSNDLLADMPPATVKANPESATGSPQDIPLITDPALAGATDASVPSALAVRALVSSALLGVRWKDPVTVAATTNRALTGEQTIDGVTTNSSRVLLRAQSDTTENGVWRTAAGAWSREPDMDAGSEFPGATVYVLSGVSLAGQYYTCSNETAPDVGSEAITFVHTGGDGLFDGDGVTVIKTGTTFSRGALTGDVTASAGSQSTTIAARAVTAGKLFAAASQYNLLFRSSSGSGDWEQVTTSDAFLTFAGAANQAGQRTALGLATVASTGAYGDLSGTPSLGALAALSTVGASQIDDNAVGNTKLRDSAALSVIGRSANSSGDPADISAGSNNTYLGRVGDALGFFGVTGLQVSNTPAGNIAATNVQAAIDELDTEKVAKAGDTMTGELEIDADTTFGLTVTRINDGNLGPGIRTKHQTATPAVSDTVSFWNIYGNNSLGVEKLFGYFQVQCTNPTSGAEGSQFLIGTINGGSNSGTLRIKSGGASNGCSMWDSVATGGDPGPGGINFRFYNTAGQTVIDQNRLFIRRRYTFGTLPAAAGVSGGYAEISDGAAAPVWGSAAAGGGSVITPVRSNGTSWVNG